IEVWSRTGREQGLRVMKKIERKIENGGGGRFTVDQNVLFEEVPAAWTHQQRRGLFVERIALSVRGRERDGAPHRVAQVDLALDHVFPRRRIGILEVGHEYICAGIE